MPKTSTTYLGIGPKLCQKPTSNGAQSHTTTSMIPPSLVAKPSPCIPGYHPPLCLVGLLPWFYKQNGWNRHQASHLELIQDRVELVTYPYMEVVESGMRWHHQRHIKPSLHGHGHSYTMGNGSRQESVGDWKAFIGVGLSTLYLTPMSKKIISKAQLTRWQPSQKLPL